MERRRLAFALGLVIAALALAGCIEDIERRELEASWEPDVQVHESPFAEVHGAPAMVVAQGPVELPADASLSITDLLGELTRENTSIPLEAMRVASEEGTQRASDAEGELSLSDGEELTVTFVPADDAPRRAHPDRAWNASLEVQWRFREGGSFDAGRLTDDANLTPEPVPDLGVGVVEREDGEVEGLVFEAIDAQQLPDRIGVEVLQVGGGTVETLDELPADAELSDGTARLSLADNVTVPEGVGYLVFRLDGVGGTATTGLRASEDPVPSPGAALAIAGFALATLAARARRGRR